MPNHLIKEVLVPTHSATLISYCVTVVWGSHLLQGFSYWNVRFEMTLRGKRINTFLELWCLVASGGLDFCVLSTSFQINDIGWPQQPPTERVSDISEKLDFWWSIPQKGTGFDHLGARDDPNIRISNFFWWNEAAEVVEAVDVFEADYCRVIQVPEFSFILMFW